MNVIKLKESKYQTDIYNKCTTGKSDWVCKSCHNSIMKNKTQMQAQLTSMELCPIELMLISQIISFKFIVAKTKVAQHGLKWQCVKTILPRS